MHELLDMLNRRFPLAGGRDNKRRFIYKAMCKPKINGVRYWNYGMSESLPYAKDCLNFWKDNWLSNCNNGVKFA